MNNSSPFDVMTLYMLGLLALIVKALISATAYTLIRLGRINSVRDMDWQTIRGNGSFFLGTDLAARARALGYIPQLFVHEQKTPELTRAASSFRRALMFAGLSFAVALVGVATAGGQVGLIILSAIVALAITIWGLAK